MAKKETFEKTVEFWRYLKIVYEYCLTHGIYIQSWRKTVEGRAWIGIKEITIPPPKDAMSMMICLHEIGHILTTKNTDRTIRSEYKACIWSEEKCEEHGVPITEEHRRDNKNYVLSYICEGIQNGKASIESLDPVIADYCGINKTEWTIKVQSGLTPFMNVLGPRWQNCEIVWSQGTLLGIRRRK